MNERIVELLAKTSAYGPGGDSMDRYNCSLSDLERFAFLIIRECMRQVEQQYQPVLEDAEMMKNPHWDGYVQCGVDSYVAIREHFFGVEL